MIAEQEPDRLVSEIAMAIGEPARVRILYCLLDGRARTSTELAAVAEVSPSTTSAHLKRLTGARLVRVVRQGKHRYYSLTGADVAGVLESLSVVAGTGQRPYRPRAPESLRAARTCYDHLAGAVGVALHDRLQSMGWLCSSASPLNEYVLSEQATQVFGELGVDVAGARSLRRRFACGCLDWSERRFHLGGALGAALLAMARQRKWVRPHLDSRALTVTDLGRRELRSRFGVELA
jgi:DNA-binding transcriptional ArsR family regulator